MDKVFSRKLAMGMNRLFAVSGVKVWISLYQDLVSFLRSGYKLSVLQKLFLSMQSLYEIK